MNKVVSQLLGGPRDGEVVETEHDGFGKPPVMFETVQILHTKHGEVIETLIWIRQRNPFKTKATEWVYVYPKFDQVKFLGWTEGEI